MEFLPEVTHSHSHDLPVGLLKDVVSAGLQSAVASLRLDGVELRAERLHLVHQVAHVARRRGRGVEVRGRTRGWRGRLLPVRS